MAYSQANRTSPLLERVGPVLVGSTVALTMALFGLLALVGGNTPGLSGRVPYYVLGAAAAFAGALMVMEDRARDGRTLLGVAIAVAAGAFVLLGLGGEGLLYAARNPDVAFATQRFLYLLSAALVTTGLGYWATNHADEAARSLRRTRLRR